MSTISKRNNAGDPLIQKESLSDINSNEKPELEQQSESSTYNTSTCWAVTVNYIIGTGVFGLPYAFYSGGITLSSISLLLFSFFLLITALWVLEIMGRAHGVSTVKPGETPVNNLQMDKYDFTGFTEIFGGIHGKAITQICLALYVYGCLWAYIATFASTLAMILFNLFSDQTCNIYDSNVTGSCQLTYYLSLFGFAVVTLPLAMLDVAEQAFLQVILTIYRFAAFGIMLITVLIALFVSGPLNEATNGSLSSLGFKWGGFPVMFSSTAVALTMHYNLPNSIGPLDKKKNSHKVVFLSMLTSFAFYWLIGGFCGYFFNSSTLPLVVLNWGKYTGLNGGWGEGQTQWWAFVIKFLIQMFPIINLLNNYPLVSITLASNYETWVPSSVKKVYSAKK